MSKSDTKHTPGPWIVVADGPWVCAPNGLTVAIVQNVPDAYTANARLIAAAPDMLEALKRITTAEWQWQHYRSGGPGEFDDPISDACQDAEAVIAKVEGCS